MTRLELFRDSQGKLWVRVLSDDPIEAVKSVEALRDKWAALVEQPPVA